jgi:hypothetical protein
MNRAHQNQNQNQKKKKKMQIDVFSYRTLYLKWTISPNIL